MTTQTRNDSVRLYLTALLLLSGTACLADVPTTSSEPTSSPLPQLRTTLAVPVQTEPVPSTLDWTQGQQWHKVTMNLNGSICIACLIELENKLRALPGIPYAKISRAFPAPVAELSKTDTAAPQSKQSVDSVMPVTTDGASEEAPNKRIDAVIIYDANAVKFDKLLTFIKNEKYKSSEIKDCTMSRDTK